jgi:3-hydroxyisobutyrate dehydrogenase-like beta-hydroxyacid dehydrogenase
MARNLLKAGYQVHVHDIRRDACADLVRQGAVFKPTPRVIADTSEIVLLSLVSVETVEEVLLGPNGVSGADLARKVIVDTSTGLPSAARRFAAHIAALGGSMLDAPLTGGESGARAGTLNIMVGGDAETFKRCLDVFQVLGDTIVHVGPSGAGQVAKMASQMILSGTYVAILEAFGFVERAGADVGKVFQAIESGGARSPQLSALGNKYLQVRAADEGEAATAAGDHYLKLYDKDIRYALQEGLRHNCDMPIATVAGRVFERGLASRLTGSFPFRLLQLWRSRDSTT